MALAHQIGRRQLSLRADPHTIEEDGACRVETAYGTVTADDVVIATHFPFKDDAFYFARMTPHFSYLMAMTLDEPVPEGVFISTDTSRTLRRHVSDGQEYLLVGGEGHITGQGGDTKARYDRIEQWARSHFAVARHRTALGHRGLPHAGPHSVHRPGHAAHKARLRGHGLQGLGHDQRHARRSDPQRPDHSETRRSVGRALFPQPSQAEQSHHACPTEPGRGH
ncbi:MAG: hypothetical protein R2851_03050 [Caldilineaceae bacterium]